MSRSSYHSVIKRKPESLLAWKMSVYSFYSLVSVSFAQRRKKSFCVRGDIVSFAYGDEDGIFIKLALLVVAKNGDCILFLFFHKEFFNRILFAVEKNEGRGGGVMLVFHTGGEGTLVFL